MSFKTYIEQIPDWKLMLHTAGTKGIVRNLPFILYCTGLGLVYITLNHWAENTIRDINVKTLELKECRWSHIDVRTQLMKLTKESNMAVKATGLGLNEIKVPPHRILINQTLSERQ